jgi:hypothetical protein
MDKRTVYGMCMAMTLCACHTTNEAADSVATKENDEAVMLSLPRTGGMSSGKSFVRSPRVFIYKLKDAGLYDHVPVIMSQERTVITSYPAPTDLSTAAGLRLPTRLEDDYLLDNKGINQNVAFLDYTYDEYSKLHQAPTMEELMTHIVDKSPLSEWRYCGLRSDYTDIVNQLNEMIKAERVQE